MIFIIIFLELWVLWKKCKHNVYLQLCYFFSHNFSPRIKLNKTRIFFYSIPLLSFTVMFIINPPYHNRKHKGSRDGMTGRKNGKRTIQAKVSIDFTWLVWILLFSCTHLKKNKIQDFSLLYRNYRKGIHVLLYIHFTKNTPLWIRIIKVTCCNAD